VKDRVEDCHYQKRDGDRYEDDHSGLELVTHGSLYHEVDALHSLDLLVFVPHLSAHDVLPLGQVRDGVLDGVRGVVDLYVELYGSVQPAYVRGVGVGNSLVQHLQLNLLRVRLGELEHEGHHVRLQVRDCDQLGQGGGGEVTVDILGHHSEGRGGEGE